MNRRPPRSKRTDTRVPYPTLFRSLPGGRIWTDAGSRESAAATVRTTVPADSVAKLRIFLTLPSGGPARQDFRFTLRALDREGGSASEPARSEEHTSELQSLMRISYAVFCLKKKNKHTNITNN